MTTDVGFADGKLPRLDGGRVIAYQCLFKRFYIPRASYSEIRKEVESADMVHLMGHWSMLNALVYLATRAMQKPYVVCPAGALPIFGRSKMLKTVYNWIIGRRIIRNANAWIAITDDERAQFEDYGIRRDSVVVIPNGINPADFPAKGVDEFKKKHKLDNRPFILFLGRLNTIKGPDILLEAFIRGQHEWPEWQLVFAGPDGGMLNSLKRNSAISATQERIHFIGYVGGTEKSAAYHAAQLLVIPSRQEAMSIVVLEAGISGTPVLLTDQCGFDEVSMVGGGKVTPPTVEGVLESLTDMLKDKVRLAEMGGELRNYVQNQYTWAIVIRKYLDLYGKLLSKV
jgi:glycosyltransferase involved in cell wall biosynthesis